MWVDGYTAKKIDVGTWCNYGSNAWLIYQELVLFGPETSLELIDIFILFIFILFKYWVMVCWEK